MTKWVFGCRILLVEESLMTKQEKIEFLKNKALKVFKQNVKNEEVKPQQILLNVQETDQSVCLTFSMNEQSHAMFVTYSKILDTLQVSYVRPAVCARATTDMIVSKMNKTVIDGLRKTFEGVFGCPTVSYDGTTDPIGFMLTTTYEWAEKGKERETIRDVRGGRGLEPYYSIFNIQEYPQGVSESEK